MAIGRWKPTLICFLGLGEAGVLVSSASPVVFLLTASSFSISQLCVAKLTEEGRSCSKHSRWLRGNELPELPRSGGETELLRGRGSMQKTSLVTSATSFNFP